jgi:uncharacterized membrane protein YkvA (DUF1232 family)
LSRALSFREERALRFEVAAAAAADFPPTLFHCADCYDIAFMWKLSGRDLLQLPATVAGHARIVDADFWTKLLRLAGRIPFAEDLAAAWFCAVDPETPGHVRGVLLAALAWFVVPASIMPEFVAVLGFTDELAVTAIAVRMVRKHLKERHYARARAALGLPDPSAEPEPTDTKGIP